MLGHQQVPKWCGVGGGAGTQVGACGPGSLGAALAFEVPPAAVSAYSVGLYRHLVARSKPDRKQPGWPVDFLITTWKRLLGRNIMTNLGSILKSRDITLPTKVHLVKVIVFPVVLYGGES